MKEAKDWGHSILKESDLDHTLGRSVVVGR